MTIRNEFPILLFLGAVLIVLIALNVQGLPYLLPMLRLVLGLAFVLYVPGYTLQAALFPRADDLDGPERLALSFGLSVAVVPPLALLLDALPWGIRLVPIVVAEATFMTVCAGVALVRRSRLPLQDRPVLEWQFRPLEWWRGLRGVERLLYAVLGLALLGFAVGAVAIITAPRPGEKLTEFYILGPEGLAENYPREVPAGQAITVTVGIANHEGVMAEYWVGAFVRNELVGQAGPLRLADEQTDERVLDLVPTTGGDDVRIDIYLYRVGSDDPYRSLRLWVKVKGE